jgi:hypothetical protein
MKFLSIIFLILLATSCRTNKDCVPETITTEKTVIVHELVKDTVFLTQRDSSSISIQLRVDTTGKIVLQELKHIANGKHLKPPEISIKDNVLKVDCISEAQKLYASWKVKYTDSITKQITIKPPSYIEKDLSIWQHIQIWLGRLFILLFITVIIVILKKYWPQN